MYIEMLTLSWGDSQLQHSGSSLLLVLLLLERDTLLFGLGLSWGETVLPAVLLVSQHTFELKLLNQKMETYLLSLKEWGRNAMVRYFHTRLVNVVSAL